MGKHKQDRIVKVETEARAEGLSYGYMMARYREQGVTPFPEPKKKPAAGVTKVCEYCGVEFTRYDKRQRKYCCDDCRNAANDLQYRERMQKSTVRKQTAEKKPAVKEVTKVCPYCGVRFLPKSGHIKYCSDMCSRRANADRNRLAYQKSIQEYVDQGYSQEAAERMVLEDIAIGMGWDFFGGAVSGGIMGSVSAPIMQSIEAKEKYGAYQGYLVRKSLEINPGNTFAQEMRGKLSGGKDLSGWQLNKLVQQNEQAMMAQDMESIRSAAAQRLTELGETGNVDTIAAALAKQAAGQKLSSEERNTISLSKYGERVSNELNAENIRSGDYSSSWTGSVDTNRINSKEYGSDLLMELAMEKIGVKRSAEESSDSYASMENPASAGENTVTSKGNLTANVKKPSEVSYEVSADGKTILKSNGEDVIIREVASVKDGKMTLRLEDGREVSSEDVSYASRDEAMVYETVANMGVNASEANVLVNAFHTGTVDADTYTLGIQEAYRYGKYNYTVQEMLERGSFASMLTEHQRKTAYKLGQVFSGRETAKAQAEVRSKQTDSAKNTNSKKGGVLYESRDGAVSELDSYLKESGKELKPIQKTAIQTMKMLSDVFGIKFYVFESYKNSEGERVWKDSSGKERSINGYYDQSDGSIHIDLNAGADGKGTMLFTMAHELTHFIKQWSPAKFKVLANFLMKQYGENGVSVDALVRRRMKKTGLGYDDAYEEVVANSMESMLSDGNVAEKLAELKKQDRGLWNKIRQFINSWVDKLRAAYKGLTPDSLEGKIVYEMKDAAERLQTLFSEALEEAGENYQAAGKQKKYRQ